MKRYFAILCAIALMLSLAACGTTDTESTTDSATEGGTVQTSPTPTQADASADESTEAPTEAGPQLAEFEEIVVVDDENCTIKITALDPDDLWGYTLTAYLENKSADKTFMFSVSSASVNGVSADPFFAAEVAPGKKANESISFTTDELEENGVGDFTDIQLDFRVYDSNDWAADDVAVATTHVYPYGQENAVQFVREAQPNDTVLVDNDQVTVIVTGFEMDEIWGYTANLFLVNKTDTSVMVTVEEASVNGFMVDPFFAESVPAGKCAFTSMSWDDDSLAENGITEVSAIEFILRVYDNDNWMAEDLVNQTVTLNP